MKRLIHICVISVILITFSLSSIVKAAEPITITAKNSLLIDLSSDREIYKKNENEKIFPAGLAKIMTAMLALQKANGNLTQKFAVTEKAMAGTTLSNAKIVRDEELTISDLVHSVLLANANEAANSLAEYVSGDIATFVKLMNEKAVELGCKNTVFTNPGGTYDEASTSTAVDIAKIAKAATQQSGFLDISSTYTYYIEATNKNKARRILISSNQLAAVNSTYYISYAKPLKSASTDKGEYSAITFAQHKIGKKSVQVLSVVLGSPRGEKTALSNAYADTKTLLEYAYNSFKPAVLLAADQPQTEIKAQLSSKKDYVILETNSSIEALMPKDYDQSKVEKIFNLPKEVFAPIEKGQKIGTVTVKYNGEEYGTVDLVSQSSITRNGFLYYTYSLKKFFSNIVVKILSAVVLIIILIYISGSIYYNIQKRKRKSVKKRIKL